MVKNLLKYECLEDENGDVVICLSGLTEDQKNAIINALAMAVTKIGESFDFIKDQSPQKSFATQKIISLIKANDQTSVKAYLRENMDSPKDARAFAYAFTPFSKGMKAFQDLLDFDMLSDEEWEEKIKEDDLSSQVKEFFDEKESKQKNLEDDFKPVPPEEEIPFEETLSKEVSTTTKISEDDVFA